MQFSVLDLAGEGMVGLVVDSRPGPSPPVRVNQMATHWLQLGSGLLWKHVFGHSGGLGCGIHRDHVVVLP